MSDTRVLTAHIKRVKSNTKQACQMITAANEAKNWLEALTQVEHRGRYDTWSAARDRAASKAGIKKTYAKHLWDRWQTMKDVSGETYRALSRAYEAECLKHENAADYYRSMERNTDGEATGKKPASAPVGVVVVSRSQKQADARRIHRD